MCFLERLRPHKHFDRYPNPSIRVTFFDPRTVSILSVTDFLAPIQHHALLIRLFSPLSHMPLSNCYSFLHSPSPASDVNLPTRPSSDNQSAFLPTHPPQSDDTLLASVSTRSDEAGFSLRSAIPSSLTSLLDAASTQVSKVTETSIKLAQSSLASVGSASPFFPPSSESSRKPTDPSESSPTSPRSNLKPASEPATANPGRGSTTFTFCLFGAASTLAIYLLARNRQNMKHLQTARSLAYRDARAWRRVALDFARINALSGSRVQSLVAAALRDGQAGGKIGRQIERELEEATRAVAQRRDWIKQQDRKTAQCAAPFSSQRSFSGAWGDIFDPHHTEFFFGSHVGRRGSELGDYGRWKPRHSSRHDDISCASSDGLSFKASEARTRASSSATSASPNPAEHSAQLKWQRAAGHSASASQANTKSPTGVDSALSASVDAQPDSREEWIGDVDRAIRERDLRSSQSPSGTDQAAVDPFSHSESEPTIDADRRESGIEDGNYLLPVSDLHIATNGQLRDVSAEVPINHVKSEAKTKTNRTKIGATKVNTTVTGTDKSSYPLSDQFGDLHDVYIAAWDDNLTGREQSTISQLKPDITTSGNEAKPNQALFTKLRSQRATNGLAKNPSTTDDEIEFMAELMFPSAAAQASPAQAKPSAMQSVATPTTSTKEEELLKQLDHKQAELTEYKYKIDELSERLDTMRDMCHDLTDEASRREKMHKIQVEQLDHKIGLFTVWAEEVQRRLGLETPPFFASLRNPLKRE